MFWYFWRNYEELSISLADKKLTFDVTLSQKANHSKQAIVLGLGLVLGLQLEIESRRLLL
jgi:hypothetical protein